MNADDEQEKLFDAMYLRYQRHYDDPASQRYRLRFIHHPMFSGISLSNKMTLEAMCGSGQTTAFLISHGARVTGLDLSTSMIRSFKKRWPACNALRASMLTSGIKDCSFDIIVVQGGLHHVQPYVESAVDEIFRILRPGGYFCFSEPHAESFVNSVRRFWYKNDPLFGKNECAIDCLRLQTIFRDRFEFTATHYSGALAYLLVYNSLIFRIPLWLKPFYAPFLTAIDACVEKIQGKRLSCFTVCTWRKKGGT